MNNVYSEFKRGDVWYVKLNTEYGDNQKDSSVQRKSRPYVIVSCEQNNNCAPILNVVPITTSESDHLPMHVYFRYKDRHQLVLCEQITTLSVLDFNRTGSHYMYSFNLDFMNQIDDALAAQLGLRPRVADMKVLENLVDKLAADKEAELKRKYETNLEARVSVIADKLAKQFGVSLTAQDMLDGVTYRPEQVAFAPREIQTSMAETAKKRMTPPTKTTATTTKSSKANSPTTSETVSKRGAKPKWDEPAMRKFMEDYKKLSVSDMANKYNIGKRSVSTFVSMFRRKLNDPKD